MAEAACAVCFSDDRDVVLRRGAPFGVQEHWCATCLEALDNALWGVTPHEVYERCVDEVKAANAPQMSRDDVIREMLEALEQARAALPDAWFAVQSNVPKEVIAAVNVAIEHGKQAMEGTKNG